MMASKMVRVKDPIGSHTFYIFVCQTCVYLLPSTQVYYMKHIYVAPFTIYTLVYKIVYIHTRTSKPNKTNSYQAINNFITENI